jgi:lipoic acid synthetase
MAPAAQQTAPRAASHKPRVRLPRAGAMDATRAVLASLQVHTVCQAAACPNRWECFGQHTATFLILGDVCTRGCAFCNIRAGTPLPVDADEPQRVAEAAARLGLRYVVVTSVTRDDLADGGAAQFAATIAAVRARLPDADIEVLTPDFQGDVRALDAVLAAQPSVFNHNLETVARLTPQLRVQASYARSLAVLDYVHRCAPDVPTKSGVMVGAGETDDEVHCALRDVRAVGCALVTIGQYLAPSAQHHPVTAQITAAQFERYAGWAHTLGFRGVACGPLVRSSYHAAALNAER